MSQLKGPACHGQAVNLEAGWLQAVHSLTFAVAATSHCTEGAAGVSAVIGERIKHGVQADLSGAVHGYVVLQALHMHSLASRDLAAQMRQGLDLTVMISTCWEVRSLQLAREQLQAGPHSVCQRS